MAATHVKCMFIVCNEIKVSSIYIIALQLSEYTKLISNKILVFKHKRDNRTFTIKSIFFSIVIIITFPKYGDGFYFKKPGFHLFTANSIIFLQAKRFRLFPKDPNQSELL